ncbi:MAG TPA: ATP-binding protein [Rhodocyclaceae bacterium]|nr:ATP-binding protein [Rhodocyclaceae bacterium]
MNTVITQNTASDTHEAPQRVVKVRRDYNTWVVNETMEDYALRFTARGFRRWSEFQVANTAFGAASFLVLEAVGATLLVNYGFINAFWAIVVVGLIIFLTGLPISYYAARYGVDMDLLTRGAGFGYIGSTITSLVYASFTFIFFALEAAIMAYALEMFFSIPPALGYLLCALAVIPLVTHGVTAITRLQALTQPIWLIMLALPFIFLLAGNPGIVDGLIDYGGSNGQGTHFNLHFFGAALTVSIALITQMGEQADYLRFMPALTQKNRKRWFFGMLMGGPGWVIFGVVKMLGGAMLAWLAIHALVPIEKAVDPNQMYFVAFGYVFNSTWLALAATAIFVTISQLKINVTNAYAGSLAWSNFFARLTHSHPGRVVWVVFNTLIALILMELNVFQALKQVLGLYSNIAIAWMMAVVADLIINKPLGLSPAGIEFRRAHLYDINPVGVGALLVASSLSIAAYFGVFGPTLEAFSSVVAMLAALITSPLIAWYTKGRYYIARAPQADHKGITACCICEKKYEADDMAWCPAYQGHICSLCCSLDARCQDLCKPHARLSAQWSVILRKLLPASVSPYLETGLGHYLMLMAAILPALALLLGILYFHETSSLPDDADVLLSHLRQSFINAYTTLALISAVVAWWLVLTSKSRQVAQEESNRQTHLLMEEIESHKRTDEQLQKATRVAEQANMAKSRYITAISHELRTPLNSILGYAQILDGDDSIPPHRRQAVNVIRRSGDHLLSVIEGTLDIARIEGGKLRLEVKPVDFHDLLQQIVRMFELQARNKGLEFRYEAQGEIPQTVRTDEKRLRQILLNVLGNAIKFTSQGHVVLRLRYAGEMARFEIEDTGPGISEKELEQIFEPFERGEANQIVGAGGTGLGLTISRMLTDLMGGTMNLSSVPGQGSTFHIRLFLPKVSASQLPLATARPARIGYAGRRQRILVVDNERDDREFLCSVLEPLGFEVAQAESGHACLALLPNFQPDLIFMDLAMPGIDGWQTIRTIRSAQASSAHIAIISANAYDKGLENDVEIPSSDFFLKPVHVNELLEWTGRRLGLDWLEVATSSISTPLDVSPEPTAPTALRYPPTEHLNALHELAQLGYVRGLLGKLDEIEGLTPDHAEFTHTVRELARRFQLEAIVGLLRKGLHETV